MGQGICREHLGHDVGSHHQGEPVTGIGYPVLGGDFLALEIGHAHASRQQVRERRGLFTVAHLSGRRVRLGRLQAGPNRLEGLPCEHEPPIRLGRPESHLVLSPGQISFRRQNPRGGLSPLVERLAPVEDGLADLELRLEVADGHRIVERSHREIGLSEPLLLQPEPKGIHGVIGTHRRLRQAHRGKMARPGLQLPGAGTVHTGARRLEHLVVVDSHCLGIGKGENDRLPRK